MKHFFVCVLIGVLVSSVTSQDLPKEVLLIKEAGLPSKILLPTGVTKTTGYDSKSPAFHFSRKVNTNLISSKKGLTDATRLLSESHDFIVSAYVKIDSGSEFVKNTIMSINSPDGKKLYLQLVISRNMLTSQMEIELMVDDTQKSAKANTPRRMDMTVWHHISVRVQDKEKLIRFYVDGKMIKAEVFDYTMKSIPSDSQLRLAQAYELVSEGTPEISYKFNGAMQDVKISLGSSDCNAPTASPQPCQCPSVGGIGCVMDGRGYKDGDQWVKDQCSTCKCKGNHVFCVHTCPMCRDGSNVYIHGETWRLSNDSCMNCKCESGQSKCSRPVCPPTNCNKPGYSGKTIVPKGKCCPVCVEDNCKSMKKVYKSCSCSLTCQNHYLKDPCSGKCTEGCYCPKGTVMNDQGGCEPPSKCECKVGDKTYKPGQIYSPSGCKFCLCLLGYMHCSTYCR